MLADLLTQTWFILLLSAALIGAVLASVHHAEVIAHKTGEPFGSLILALAVTVIEVSLIVSMMLAGHEGSEFIARDAVFATVMIILNGVIGICIFIGGRQHYEMGFRSDGAMSSLSVLATLVTFTLVMPIVTTSTPGPDFTKGQLAFAGVASFVMYGGFLFFQSVSHRDYYLPKFKEQIQDETVHAEKPTNIKALMSLGLLIICLVLVVGLAKALSPAIESGVKAAGLPKTVVGIAIALLVLLPESFAALRAARANRLQSSLNLALGSALATIGLTIPAVAVIALWFDLPLSLGISSLNITLLFLSIFIGGLTLSQGKTTVLQGAVHLMVFFEYLFSSVVP